MREDFKKQLRGSAKFPRLIPGMQVVDPKRRIIVLVGMFVLMIFVAVMLKGYSKRPETQEIPRSEGPPSAEMPGEPRFSGVPTLDRGYIDKVKDDTAKEQEAWDEEPIAYLLSEAENTPAVFAYSRKLIRITAENAEMFDKNAKNWRFQFIRFRGKLEYKKTGDYEDISGGGSGDIGDVHLGRVLIAGGKKPVRVVFVTPNVPTWQDFNSDEIAPVYKVIEDGWVRGRGIFVKRYLDVGPDGEEVPTFLVVATKVQRDFEEQPVESLESIPFQIIQDHVGLLNDDESRRLLFKTYPKTLFRLIRWATPRAGPEGKALREKDQLKVKSIVKPADYEDVVSNPQRYRTKYVGALGALADTPLYVGPEEIDNNKANDAGIDEYVTGWIVTDEERLVQFIAPAVFAKLGLKRRSRVWFAGYFYKTQGYHSRDGSDRLAPMIVLTELREVIPAPPDYTVELIIAIGFILGISMLVFIIVREDKTKQDYRERMRGRKIA